MAASDLKRILCVVAALAVSSAVHAQGFSDPVDEVLESMGLKTKEREPIDYRERAPLVVPPAGVKLRAPEDAAAGRNAQWPKDPDVASRKRRADEARMPSNIASNRDPSDELVGPAEGRKRNAYAGVPTRSITSEGENPAMMIPREQVRGILSSSVDGTKPLGVDPARQYLTEPPKGYRKAAAGAPMKGTVDPMRTDENFQINALRPAQ